MGCYSSEVVEGFRNSNLYVGVGTDPISYYLDDPAFSDAENRWYLLRPETKLMGSGAAGSEKTTVSHALTIWEDSYDTTGKLTAWPSAGYFPTELLPTSKRWSLQSTGTVDLSAATVTVTGPSGQIRTTISARLSDMLVWNMPALAEVKGSGTVTYTVKVSGIRGGATSSHSYDVRVIDGDLGDPVPKPVPVLDYPEKLYREAGRHDYNGRKWNTTCEPYSSTTRCRTEIWATTIAQGNGGYEQQSGWLFNNLTYLPSERGIWAKNQLGGLGQQGYNKEWVSDGRQWRTECDTPATGRGGCRTFIMATVIETVPGGGFRSVNKWLFNNIVLFS